MKLNNKLINIIAALLLLFVFFVSLFSMRDDSATMDEVAHLPAGYSYLTQKDMRLNPEHPPLLKDLAAIPLLFIKGINFPSEIKDWKEDINGQWGFGYHFLYHSGNPADQMIFWGRIPMILILILLGFYIFKFSKELFGPKTALLALFLFSFSPTFLAHGRLVTTDVGAAFGVVFAIYYFLKALKEPSWKNIFLSGLALGIAQLLKFSLILLIPLFIFLAFVWFLLTQTTTKGLEKLKEALKILTSVFLLAFLLIWFVYFYHTLNYPLEKQLTDTKFILTSYAGGPSSIKETCLSPTSFQKILRCPGEITIWAADKPILRSLAHYSLGLLMIFQRAAGGHTTYFLGKISAAGWKNYFPVVYVIKEPLAFHILTLIALLYLAWLIKKPFWINPFQRIKDWIKSHFPEFAMFSFITLYWLTSLTSNLNIGVRHLLPVFPFTMILVSAAIIHWLKPPLLKLKYALLIILILWQAVSVISIYPHFLAYFNEIAGGADKAYIYVTNSNLDWGQDLKRLKKWVDQKEIDKIYVDYFGGGDAKYYLKEKYASWQGQRDPKELPKGSYLAISATFLQGGRGFPAPGFDQPHSYYHWLDQYQPLKKIGYSIFIYYID
ncbi:MAG: glycosyltransferase family 39 protein [Patescibacteria group bacterium]|nr:glycosyltransferase family 39 protein [Patescibacteria group bacterium]